MVTVFVAAIAGVVPPNARAARANEIVKLKNLFLCIDSP
jgi:hypothetical protein